MPSVTLRSNVNPKVGYWLERVGSLWVIMAKQGRKKAQVGLDIYYLYEKDARRTMERLADGEVKGLA